MNHFFLLFTFICMIAIIIKIILLRKLFAIIIINSLFSIFCVIYITIMGAPDVALTEAAVGNGISMALSVLTLFIVKPYSYKKNSYNNRKLTIYKYYNALCLLISLIICIYLLKDAPILGNFSNPAINEVYLSYIKYSYNNYKIPNIITVILGGFRGYDTMLETFVIFIACVSVIILIGRINKRKL